MSLEIYQSAFTAQELESAIAGGRAPSADGLTEFPLTAYTVPGADLQSIGNAVAEAVGAEEPLSWPEELRKAVEDMQVAFWNEPNVTTTANQARTVYTRNMVCPQETHVLSIYSQCPELETFEAPYFTGVPAGMQFFNCAKLRSIRFPRVTKITNNYFIRQQAVTSVIEEIQLGSIGYPFTELAVNWNYGNNHSGCTVTFYVDAATIAEAQASITNWAAYGGQNTSNCTIVFRNSTTGEVITE